MESVLISMLRSIALITGGEQHKYFCKKLQDARIVECESIQHALDAKTIQRLKNRIDVEQKRCYKNASLVAYILSSWGYDCKYVEGEMTCMRSVPIEHAWNSITIGGKTKYFDVTVEWAFGKTPKNEEYMALGEYAPSEVRAATKDTGMYGDIYYYYYKQSLKH